MMPLRVVIPASVMKPIAVASDSVPPLTRIAKTLPTSANGTLAMMISASTPSRVRARSQASAIGVPAPISSRRAGTE